ncbi:outer membrane lipoprotein carrier protein LolA [Gallibacterium trehalosifermentans]|uniref:Outer membrane lipoprotein carrier protein LolA n=1 Tax=Gallibacterium trehalosifermentans TaxID=516935 RepID=A0ABV6H0N3_9PAST
MRKYFSWLLIGLLLSLGIVTQAAQAAQTQQQTLAQIVNRLAIPATMRCQFSQQRFLTGLKKPLNASGKMWLDQKQGIALLQQQPFEQMTALAADKLIQIIQQQKQVIYEKDQPQLFHITRLLFSLFQGDFNAIPNHFEITELEAKSAQWSLVLVPKQAPLNLLFSQISLRGDRHIESLTILDKQQDQTLLQFEQCQQLEKLSNEQQIWFNAE